MILLANLPDATALCSVITCQLEHGPRCVRNCHQDFQAKAASCPAFTEKQISARYVSPDHIITMDKLPPTV